MVAANAPFLSPLRGWRSWRASPTAHAVGYGLSALRARQGSTSTQVAGGGSLRLTPMPTRGALRRYFNKNRVLSENLSLFPEPLVAKLLCITSGVWSWGMIAKNSVAYGNEIAGLGGRELSWGEIAHSGNTVCGRRADRRVNLPDGASAAQYSLLGRNRRTDPWRAERADCSSAKATMFMKRSSDTGRAGGKTGRKAEIQIIETKQVTRCAVGRDAFFAKLLPKRLYS